LLDVHDGGHLAGFGDAQHGVTVDVRNVQRAVVPAWALQETRDA
jgi:hypothetical protein